MNIEIITRIVLRHIGAAIRIRMHVWRSVCRRSPLFEWDHIIPTSSLDRLPSWHTPGLVQLPIPD